MLYNNVNNKGQILLFLGRFHVSYNQLFKQLYIFLSQSEATLVIK